MATEHGVNPFYNSVSLRLLCCNIRKVNPLNKALKEFDAWVTGLRRSQGETRNKTGKVEIDSAHGNVIKINPLADWSYDEVWDYIHTNKVRMRTLHPSSRIRRRHTCWQVVVGSWNAKGVRDSSWICLGTK